MSRPSSNRPHSTWAATSCWWLSLGTKWCPRDRLDRFLRGFAVLPCHQIDRRSGAQNPERDIVEGDGHTGIKVGMIKTRIEESLKRGSALSTSLRVCARLNQRSGLPLTVHTSTEHRTGEVACSILEEEGVDPARVIIGHAGDSDEPSSILRGILGPRFRDRDGPIRIGHADHRRPACGSRRCSVWGGYAGQMILSDQLPSLCPEAHSGRFRSLGRRRWTVEFDDRSRRRAPGPQGVRRYGRANSRDGPRAPRSDPQTCDEPPKWVSNPSGLRAQNVEPSMFNASEQRADVYSRNDGGCPWMVMW